MLCSVRLKSKSLCGVFVAFTNFSFFPNVVDTLEEERKTSDGRCGTASYSCGIGMMVHQQHQLMLQNDDNTYLLSRPYFFFLFANQTLSWNAVGSSNISIRPLL